ncbi:MAG: lytic transglycosylase domain-containing protein [bacterium]|nr:lytic transglycosylase domain-containing protein [Candidatus Kapabacteria bacterium]
MTRRLRTSLVIAAIALIGGRATAQIQDDPKPGFVAPDSTYSPTGADSVARVAAERAAAEEAKRAAAEEARRLADEAKQEEADAAKRVSSQYARAIAREWQALDYVTLAYLERMPEDSLLRLVSTPGRRAAVGAPFTMKGKADARKSTVPKLISPTFAQSFTTDSTVEALVGWYSRRFGFEFVVHRTLLSGMGAPDTLTVARAVRRIGNTMVSVMIWNPTQNAAKKKAIASLSEKTSVSVQERSFRSREELIVEGTDAIVEFNWKVPYRDLITKVSSKYQIDPYLIAALVQQESNFNAGAMSVDSAMGLTQMIPGTAAMMGVRDPSNPSQSLDGGVRYLKLMLKRFRGDVVLALAAYNAGPGNVDKYNGVPPFAETRDYVKRIMARYKEKAGGPLAAKARVVKQRS